MGTETNLSLSVWASKWSILRGKPQRHQTITSIPTSSHWDNETLAGERCKKIRTSHLWAHRYVCYYVEIISHQADWFLSLIPLINISHSAFFALFVSFVFFSCLWWSSGTSSCATEGKWVFTCLPMCVKVLFFSIIIILFFSSQCAGGSSSTCATERVGEVCEVCCVCETHTHWCPLVHWRLAVYIMHFKKMR